MSAIDPRTAVAIVLLGLVTACSSPAPEDTGDVSAVVTPVPSPTATVQPEEAPSPDTEDEPTPSAAPSPSPSPTTSGDLDEDEALAAARARQEQREDCDSGFAAEAHRVVTTVDDRMLVFVACFIGAYQPTGELLVWDGTSLEVIPVQQWQFGDVLESPEVVGFVDAASDGTTVVNEVKYRGLGDCGLFQQWTFDASSLVLDLAREQECDDEGEFVPPSEWPTVYAR